MLKLKNFFVMGMLISVLTICAFAPGICIDRFLLPDSLRVDCDGPSHVGDTAVGQKTVKIMPIDNEKA